MADQEPPRDQQPPPELPPPTPITPMPDRDVVAPPSEYLTEGYDPTKLHKR